MQTRQTQILAATSAQAVSAQSKNYFVDELDHLSRCNKFNHNMAKKRKAGGRPAQKNDAPMRTKFNANERFEDSEDEFQANRDQILLEEAPEAKRRRKVAEDGM